MKKTIVDKPQHEMYLNRISSRKRPSKLTDKPQHEMYLNA